MSKQERYAVYVVHPDNGQPAWFKSPGEGWTFDLAEAHLWHPVDLARHIERVTEQGGDWGTRYGDYPCRIRQVWTDA